MHSMPVLKRYLEVALDYLINKSHDKKSVIRRLTFLCCTRRLLMISKDEQRYILCPFCHKPNPVEKVFCQYCWSRLDSGMEVSAEGAREILRQLQATFNRRKEN